jgi:hypothetical protein
MMADTTAVTWENRLRKITADLAAINERRQGLLEERIKLLRDGYSAGYATQMRISELTGLSRGRVQQLLG